MPKTILITGGSGLIGKALTKHLQSLDRKVRWLTRNPNKNSDVEQFYWDIEKGEIDNKALVDIESIIHLAGASVGGKKWTNKYKNEMSDSRIKSCQLLYRACEELGEFPETFISSSAIGYYGYDSGAVWKKEGSRFGDDFLASLTKEWEETADHFMPKVKRVVKFRTGLVLSAEGGGLEKMQTPVKFGLGAPLGSGEQYMSWIHLQDVVNAYTMAIFKNIEGTYNLVAPNPVTNKEFMKTLSKVLKKPFFLPPVPSFALKLALGEMSAVVLGSTRASAEKLMDAGFSFSFKELESALKDIY